MVDDLLVSVEGSIVKDPTVTGPDESWFPAIIGFTKLMCASIVFILFLFYVDFADGVVDIRICQEVHIYLYIQYIRMCT